MMIFKELQVKVQGAKSRLYGVIAAAFLLPLSVFSQTDTSGLKYNIHEPKPWEKKGHSTNVDLKNPVQGEWKYNPKTNRYEEFTTVGGLTYPSGRSLSVTEYYQKLNRESRDAYYREKGQNTSYSAGSKGKSGINDYIHPVLQNPTISKIFGEGGVDFQLSGSAMIKLGGNMNVNRNPNFSKRQQRYFVPVFDQQLQISANGSIGQYVKLGINYDTEAAFEFDNQTNMGWKGKPDGILKDVQVGNVSLNLPTQLIKPTNNLFGFSTTMQFGKTTVKSVFSQNKGQSTETVLQGGAQLNEFRITSDNYDQNRHYFLSQFFRDNYNKSLENMPIVASGVVINRVEVWVTNRNANVETPRDILAFQDLGESSPYRTSLGGSTDPAADNNSNNLYNLIQNDPDVRMTGKAIDRVNALFGNFEQTVDYDMLNYARQLTQTEFSFHSQLGYISLNQPLNNDEILAVAFEYTYNGKTYQVGEFSRDVPPGDQKLLYLKMLKGNTIRTRLPIWRLMMKNIYTLNTYSLSLEDFKLNVIYHADTSGTDYNYLPVRDAVPAFANGNPLIRVLGLDHLNRQYEAKPDGIFDAIEGLTVQTQYARIIFPVTEPFGSYLRTQFGSRTDLADYYAYDALYDSTKFLAAQDVRHNKFFLVGSYKSPNGAELFLGTTNLQKGSVRVTANGRPLVEGSDYEVDYALGRVRIINQGLLAGGAEIRASADGQSFFNIQQKTLVGGRIEHKFNNHLLVGGTLLHLYERPLTTKTNFNEEPLLNTIMGADVAYSNKSRFITKLVDKLPFIETKEISNITAYGEFAKIFPHNHKSQGGQRGVSNLDDFENAELPNDYKMVTNWVVASPPQKQPDLLPETQNTDKKSWLYRHARLSFYTIDPLFYRDADMPDNIKSKVDIVLSDPYQRQVDQREVFPQRQFPQGTPTILPTLDLVYNPRIRGQYNFNTDASQINAEGRLLQPEKSWAGIMRRVDQNDFEAANIDYIEVWMMDPLIRNQNLKGDFYLNLGSVSEDVLPDRRKSFENGLPSDGNYNNTDTTEMALVPSTPQINYAFDNNINSLIKQDVGLDGGDDDWERDVLDKDYLNDLATKFGTNSQIYQEALADPGNDNFRHYLEESFTQTDADIIGRYKYYQGPQGNSNSTPYQGGKYNGMPKSSTSVPNDEDVNRDFTMNQSEDYYQYHIKIDAANLEIGKNYVTDVVRNSVKLRNGKEEIIKWYQFKIPIRQYEKAVGNISDFKSIRFMRMFMTNFNDSAIFRIGYINMVRADWRRYTNSLKTPGVIVPADPNDGTKFVVSTVNLEENGKRSPIAYVTPPGVVRVQNMASLGTVLENEQSLSLLTCNMKPGDARGAFKTTQVDVRNYKRMQMFVHAESEEAATIQDGELSAFVRFGTDLTSNYYEYEIPLKLTRGFINKTTPGADKLIWPDENFIDIEFDEFYALKIARLNAGWPMTAPFIRPGGKGKVSVMGLPDVGNIRVMMVGIKNNGTTPHCFEVWLNELRVKDIANNGGWAALGNVQMQLADFGTLNMAGSIRTIGFGDVDKKLNDRSLSTNMNYDISSNLQLGKFFPAKKGVSMPMYIGYSENYIRPKFNPLNPDLELKEFLSQITDPAKRDAVRKAATDYSSLYSFNLNNVRIAQPAGKKARLWSISNFNATYSYQKNYRRNQQIEEYFAQTTQVALGYNYGFTPKSFRPFKKLKGSLLMPLREFNVNLLPSNIQTQFQVNRYYSEMQSRNNNNFVQVNPRLFDKNFTFNRTYILALPLFSSLSINYNATANARIQEPYGRLNTQEKKDSVRTEFLTLGRMTKFNQQIAANYRLPFDKFKFLNWMSGNVNYTGSYEWQQAPPAFSSLGNKIQNARSITVQTNLNFTQLYQKIPWLRDLEKPKKKGKTPEKKTEEPKFESALDRGKEEKKKANPAKIFAGNFISMFKNASVNYDRKEGTELPGFAYKPDYFGQNFLHNKPGLPFVIGWQDTNIRYKLANSGSLLKDPRQANFYRNTFTEGFTGNVTLEPIKAFRIQLDFAKNTTRGSQSVFRHDGTQWVDQGLTETGSYNTTGWFWKTHFVKDLVTNKDAKNHPNPVFIQMLNNRYSVSQYLGNRDSRSQGNGQFGNGTDTVTGYAVGYSKTSQDVLIGAFYTAYSGLDPGRTKATAFPNITLPNWSINYNGLTRIKALSKHFTNINIRHGYQGRYTVGNYTRNLKYDMGEAWTPGKDFTPRYQISDVTISEGFYPLLGLNVSTKNNWTLGMEYKRTRILKLFAASFNVTEMRNNEFTLNAGYRIAGLTLPFRRNGRKVYLPNDFRFDLAVSVGDNVTIIRKVDVDVNNYTAGMRNIRINPSMSYQVNQKINLALRYNRVVMDPKVAMQFYTALTDFALEVRYTLQ
ncbi:MAG: cell surface protein SprA [Bacteroidetes bacterium]|nr:cell surface protein SprA [Bacteroidota bacterium]